MESAHRAALSELTQVSQYAGVHVEFVQAGGGNTSAKTPDGAMYTKASGVRLEELDGHRGISRVNVKRLLDELLPDDRVGAPSGAALGRWDAASRRARDSAPPSLEVTLHALLGRVVLHTHPVVVNAFLCARGGATAARRVLAAFDSLILPYRRPGLPVGRLLLRRLWRRVDPPTRGPTVVLLENHGLVVSGPSAREVINTHRAVIAALRRALGAHETQLSMTSPSAVGLAAQSAAIADATRESASIVAVTLPAATGSRGGPGPQALFPDAAVYCGARPVALPDGGDLCRAAGRTAEAYVSAWGQPPRVWRADRYALCAGRTLEDARAVAEVCWAQEEVLRLGARVGPPKWLTGAQVRELLGWDAERYRRSVAAGHMR